MNKFVIVTILIILGLFMVLVFNNNSSKPETAVDQFLSDVSTGNPSPTMSSNISATPSSNTKSLETKSTKAIIKTTKGDIELTLYPDDAPGTVKNFAEKAKSGYYNNLIFHRVEDWVIQGGDPDGNGTGGGDMPTELNKKPFVVGSLGVARGGDIEISNDSQFFITKQDATWLNGQYTNFGIVTKGMDVVNKIDIGDSILEIQISP